MKDLSTENLIQTATYEIEKVAPKNSQVEIDIKEDPVGNFRTNIKLITRSKTYFSKKEDTFMYKSLTKALRALKAQINKKRTIHSSAHLNFH